MGPMILLAIASTVGVRGKTLSDVLPRLRALSAVRPRIWSGSVDARGRESRTIAHVVLAEGAGDVPGMWIDIRAALEYKIE